MGLIYIVSLPKSVFLENKFLFFWGHTPAADGHINEACFSQWWECSFRVDDVEYSCAEQFMMAEKARMFGDEAMLAEIMKASHPKEMIAFGRAVSGFDKEAWDRTCYEIVKRENVAKFSQNPELLDFLLGTKKESWWRRARGIGSGGSAWGGQTRMPNAP